MNCMTSFVISSYFLNSIHWRRKSHDSSYVVSTRRVILCLPILLPKSMYSSLSSKILQRKPFIGSSSMYQRLWNFFIKKISIIISNGLWILTKIFHTFFAHLHLCICVNCKGLTLKAIKACASVLLDSYFKFLLTTIVYLTNFIHGHCSFMAFILCYKNDIYLMLQIQMHQKKEKTIFCQTLIIRWACFNLLYIFYDIIQQSSFTRSCFYKRS